MRRHFKEASDMETCGDGRHPVARKEPAGRPRRSRSGRLGRHCGVVLWAGAAALSFLSGNGLTGAAANAEEFVHGNVTATADITLTHGVTVRAQKRDEARSTLNTDDGNRNYDRGLVSNSSGITGEFELSSDNVGAFLRTHGFVDFENEYGDRERTPLTGAAKDVVGKDFTVLDAYVYGAFDPGGIPLDVRLGNQVLNWGESTFIPSGINVINPVDLGRLRRPGSKLREGLVPVPIASATIEPVDGLSLEGFFQLSWKKAVLDPAGSYFSFSDFVGAGGRYTFVDLPGAGVSDMGRNFMGLQNAINADLVAAAAAGTAAAAIDPRFAALSPWCGLEAAGFTGPDCQLGYDPYFLAIERTSDVTARHGGQWGIAMRHVAETLNDTEFGVFFSNLHSRYPLISARVGTPIEVLRSAGTGAAIASPTSTTTQAVADVVTPAVTAAFRQQIEAQIPAGAPNRGTLVNQQLALQAGAIQDEVQKQVGRTVAGLAGVLTADRFAKQANYFIEYPENLKAAGFSFNTALGTTGWALQGEYSFRPDAPLQREASSLFAEGQGALLCFRQASANPAPGTPNPVAAALAYCLAQPEIAMSDGLLQGYVERDVSQAQVTATRAFGPVLGSDSTGFIAEAAFHLVHDMPDSTAVPLQTAGRGKTGDAASWGYQAVVLLDYNNAIGAAKLTPYLRFQHDVSGSSPVPSGPFVEGRKVVTIGVTATYLQRWIADISYTAHAGSANYLSDRDFVMMSFSYAF